MDQASDEPVIPLDYVIALSAGARKLTDFISDRLFVQMTVNSAAPPSLKGQLLKYLVDRQESVVLN